MIDNATCLAVRRTADFLTQRLDLTLKDVRLLINITCDVKIAQWTDANYDTEVYVEVPKYLDKIRVS